MNMSQLDIQNTDHYSLYMSQDYYDVHTTNADQKLR